MSYISLEEQLNLLESQFSKVSIALRSGNLNEVQASCADLQQLAVDFLQIADEVGRFHLASAPLAVRIKALSNGMPALSSNLFRRLTVVEQALKVVVPTCQKPTYAKTEGRFGAGFSPSGQMRSLSA